MFVPSGFYFCLCSREHLAVLPVGRTSLFLTPAAVLEPLDSALFWLEGSQYSQLYIDAKNDTVYFRGIVSKHYVI